MFNPDRSVREQRTLSVRSGLNVVRLESPLPPAGKLPEGPALPTINPDSLPLLYFEQGSYTLLASSKAALVQTAAYLLRHPELKLRLIGHTDREGDERLNRLLSENRAKVVSSFLYEQGISDERMERIGHGSRFLAAPSDIEANKAKNRRVQMKLITNPTQ